MLFVHLCALYRARPVASTLTPLDAADPRFETAGEFVWPLIAATRAAAIAAVRWSGRGDPMAADDAAYCANLSELALRYLSYNSRRGIPDADIATAVDQCQKGNRAEGISTLERKLRNSGFTLPQR